MARHMKLFLIRHGESVDNVAQLYAGGRDSELTNQGWQQATRLGRHFHALGLNFTHIFSSHLQRAAKTAGLVREAQLGLAPSQATASRVPDVVPLPTLMEQDFGSLEGKKWSQRRPKPKLTGNEHRHREQDTSGFVDMESEESMAERVDTFLDDHLLPLLIDSVDATDLVVAVVSHGIILSVLWKRLLLRLPPRSVVFSPKLSGTVRTSLAHVGGWSNTGYLELHMEKKAASLSDTVTAESAMGHSEASSVLFPVAKPVPITEALPSKVAHGLTMVIQTINGRDHLKGLKRTGGGVGSARYDISQSSIESFFKRRRVE